MSRFAMVILAVLFLAGCNPVPASSLDQEVAVEAPKETAAGEKEPPRPTGQQQPLEEEVLAAARLYMENQGLKVGDSPGEVVLSVENIWGGRAVVIYGFAASEFFAELGLSREANGWRVIHDQARYFSYEDVNEPVATLAKAEGYVFGEEPGKYLLGVKDVNLRRAVLLVAPYGTPWDWEYTLAKRKESWVITAKNKANEHWEPAR